ncbi:MAG: T9SS type A sorting domain-containing protein [Candidatus Krumholzibacteriota bacterium]|nr:T9SS type A sorting domain-containing protein [Candidatus Krumholzibacteriota bacterium]
MSGGMRIMLVMTFCSIVIAVPSIRASWVEDGLPICTAAEDQMKPVIISDGADGAIIAWYDGNIVAQRLDDMGNIQWAPNGVVLSAAANTQIAPTIVSDGTGGAIVAWFDYRSGGYDIYAQRVDASGTVQWLADGVAICQASLDQRYPKIASDGAGGAVVTWHDRRSGNLDIFAQRVDASGTVQWTADGEALCTAANTQDYPEIVSDESGWSIVTWEDYRSGDYDIYAQRVNCFGSTMWTIDGVALCAAAEEQFGPRIVSDGAAGAIVTWYDYRDWGWDIYAQRINASGTVQWTADGVALVTETHSQVYPAISSDGVGGAIVAWQDLRNGDYDIYAQRLDASGAVQWTANGIAICAAAEEQRYPVIISDGAGGAIIVWQDFRNGEFNIDIYAQRVDSSGTVQWATDGVAICAAPADQDSPMLVSCGPGGAIVTWQDMRSGGYDIYAQLVDGEGRIGSPAPSIISVLDVPGDQGGWVRITIDKSPGDDELEFEYPVSIYNIWQRIDDPELLAVCDLVSDEKAAGAAVDNSPPGQSVDAPDVSCWPIREVHGRSFIDSRDFLETGELPAGTWELLGSFAACQQDQYIYRASTLADSTESGIAYSVYMVSAHTVMPSVWYTSIPDSGYSVDNLPPEPPEGLMADQSAAPEGLKLTWNVNVENDLSHYAVYRGSSEDFVPEPGNKIATPVNAEYFDSDWHWSSNYYYKISALDVHGNESGFAILRPDDVTGSEIPGVPATNYLAQNFPNPFNPVTRIEYGLSAPANVSLKIYDAAGRLVRELVDEGRAAARYAEVWDGRDDAGRQVASGMYFYRIEAGEFTATKKLVLLR